MIKQAIIPLAGLGTRLLPLTSVFAKELLPINGKPGLEYIIDECIEAGIKEIIFIISNKKIIDFEIPTGNPLLITFDENLEVKKYKYLDDKRARNILFNV